MAQLGYVRTSTAQQTGGLDRQHDELTAAGCERIWVEAGVSGTKSAKPELEKLIDYARAGDTIVVTELSRLGRTVRQLVVLVDDLGERGIGMLLLSIFAALAQLEREVLVDRTLSGLAAARARGRVGGRPPVLVGERLEAVRAMHSAGTPKAAIARSLGVSRTTVHRALDERAKESEQAEGPLTVKSTGLR